MPLPRYSCCIRPVSPDRCRENHARIQKTNSNGSWKKSRRSRSSQLNLLSQPPQVFGFSEDPSDTYGLLNINTSTAEELMTLPGINRSTATNIVVYRAQIGFFRKIEDLVLVPGVGATRFGHLKAEICVGLPTNGVLDSSSLVRSSSSTTSSGIDVSVTPADNVSREYGGIGLVAGSERTSLGRYSPLYNDSKQSNLNGDLDGDTVGLLRRSMQNMSSRITADRDATQPLRIGTWNMIACSTETADNVCVREVFSLTVLKSR